MKKVILKIKKDPTKIVKETPETRLERIHNQSTYTRVVENKKAYKRVRNRNIVEDDET
jgi:hypothetical protein